MKKVPLAVAKDLKKEVKKSSMSLRRIAREAGVSYYPLQRWMAGKQEDYGLVKGEKVFRLLTGRTFTGGKR